MHRALTIALLSISLMVFSLLAWCTDPSPVRIPARGEPGWTFSPPDDHSQPAPSGYEGRTDTSTLIATGDKNNPSTAGKRIKATFKFGNEIKTCPQADGTAEGTGVFIITVDSTDAQANARTTIEMRAEAKYEGHVGDNGYVENPVNAKIDYTYTQTGTIRANGALLNTSVSAVPQHITIPVVVGRDISAPGVGLLSGGDPTAGHYAEAYKVGAALAHWAGFYYSVAQTRWMQGQCVEIIFNPPSDTVALGAQIDVKAEVRTKSGERVKAAQFRGALASSGAVSPGGGPSSAGAPLKFVYSAPDQRVPHAGFSVAATSVAGAAKGEWNAGLGSGWSGQISCSRTITGDTGTSELLDWANSSVTRLTIEVKDGKATATGYGQEQHFANARKKRAIGGGQTELVRDYSTADNGTVQGSSPATVDVFLDKPNGRYSVGLNIDKPIEGKYDSGAPLSVTQGICLQAGLLGKLSDPNRVQGSVNDTRSGIGRSGSGTDISITTWNLARRGNGQ